MDSVDIILWAGVIFSMFSFSLLIINLLRVRMKSKSSCQKE